MAKQLYFLVLDGEGRRKLHAPDCRWVAGSTANGELGARRYGLERAEHVDGDRCRWCGGSPGPGTGSWPIRS